MTPFHKQEISQMDRQSTIGLVLIAFIFILWFYLSSLYAPIPEPQSQIATTDSIKQSQQVVTQAPPAFIPAETTSNLTESQTSFATYESSSVVIETSEFVATLQSKGGNFSSFILKEFLTDGKQVDLITLPSSGNMNYSFVTGKGEFINTRLLNFSIRSNKSKHVLTENESVKIELLAEGSAGEKISLIYEFKGKGFFINHQFQVQGFGFIPPQNITQTWFSGIAFTEHNHATEYTATEAFVYDNKERDYLNATSTSEIEELRMANVAWSAIRSKYFAVYLVNTDGQQTNSRVYGQTVPLQNLGNEYFINGRENVKEQNIKIYNIEHTITFGGGNSLTKQTDILLTPLVLDYLKTFPNNFQAVMSFGIPILVAPLSEYIILPIFELLRDFLPSWGIVILVFTLLIKIVTYPLTQSSYVSSKKMAAVAPKMKELQEKYKDDKEKLQQEMLKMYREYGYNPVSGCLPMLLQMPILFSLYTVFSNAIQLRQSEFLYVSDLSLPDAIIHLPFSIPIYGAHISFMALALAVSQVIQMKMTPQTAANEQMKMMMWIFPVMMLLIFNNMSAGLNMYYLLFTLLTILQQKYLNPNTSSLLEQPAAQVTNGKK